MGSPFQVVELWLCLNTRSGFERLFFRLAASGSIDDKTNIACFAVFASRKNLLLSGRRRSFQKEPRKRWPGLPRTTKGAFMAARFPA